MPQFITRAAFVMCLAGGLACAGCRGEPDRFQWASPLAWRPFRARPAEVASTYEAEAQLSTGQELAGGSSEPESPVGVEVLPAVPLAPPAADLPASEQPFPYLPEPARSTLQPQSGGTPSSGRRQKLNDLIEGIRERGPAEPRPSAIPWDAPVANAGMDMDDDELTLAPLVVAFEQSQPVMLGAPEFDGAVASPAQAPVVEVAAPAPRTDGLTVFEREFKALRR
jgi:hypothetical protein